MPRRMPNLNQLRAFEATARLLSFKDAASELFVTQAAISHQIKALEEELGHKLFHRQGREVSLTEKARNFVAEITPAFDQIAKATATMKSNDLAGTLKLSMGGFLADRLLRPNLAEFKELFPKLRLDMSYFRDFVDFDEADIHAAVLFGESDRKGIATTMLYNKAVPVCSPSLVDGREFPMSVEEIIGLPLATTKDHTTGWLEWLAAAGIEETSNLDFVEFEDGGLAFYYATSGRGVAMAIEVPLIRHELSTGSLVVVNPRAINPQNHGIYLAYPETQYPDPKILAFGDWFKSVVERIQAG